jgi:hypothetical protein
MENKTQISIKDLAKNAICPGHLYLQTSSNRKFYLMKPGTFIDFNFVKKHAALNTVFEINTVTKNETMEKFYSLFKEFVYLQFEKDLRLKAFEILKLFQKVFDSGDHFLNFVIPCHQVFLNIPTAVIEQMNETDVYLARKALYSAAFSVIISMANGIYHPLMIKDLYNLTFCLDVGICGEDYSYFVAQACNQENRKPGTGKIWLQKNHATKAEIQIFLDHSQRSYFVFEHDQIPLIHKELSQILLYQHELSNGKGFPRGISKSLVSAWESVVILADSMVEIQEEFGFENKVMSYILNFKNEKMGDLPLNKVYQRLRLNLTTINELEKTGT